MKLMIASDLHGSAFFVKKLMDRMEAEQPDKLLLLGDLLYHGPRNALPEEYSCPSVADQLNAIKEKIVAVRGNCDSEVDQMVLEFPIMADYALMEVNGRTLFLTHGHLFNADMPPLLKAGDLLLNGHFHTPCCREMEGGATYVNCGSISLPKDSTPHSYILIDGNTLYFKDLETGGIFDCFDL